MKILCICHRGNSRSVGLAWLLKDHLQQDAIAMGIEAAAPDTQKMLFDWADLIIVVDKTIEPRIPEEYKGKMKIFDVGGDRYFRGFEPDLINQYVNYINQNGL